MAFYRPARWQKPAALIVLLGLAVLPMLLEQLDQSYYTGFATRVLIFALAASSLNLVLGFGGMVSLGHAAFFGQAGGCGMPVPAGFGLGHVTHGFQQAGLELVRGQRVQRKRLVFGQFVEFAKADFQPAVQEGGGRLARETCERDGVGPAVPVRQRQGQCCGGFGRWIGCVVDGAPVAVVGKERRLVRLRAGVRRPDRAAMTVSCCWIRSSRTC